MQTQLLRFQIRASKLTEPLFLFLVKCLVLAEEEERKLIFSYKRADSSALHGDHQGGYAREAASTRRRALSSPSRRGVWRWTGNCVPIHQVHHGEGGFRNKVRNMNQHSLSPRIMIQHGECRPLWAGWNCYKIEQHEMKLENRGMAILQKASCSKWRGRR